MFVSVLIPVYGVERWIERCARSLLGQSWADAEFIFVDDASPDVSTQVLRKVMADYPGRDVRILTHDTNKGLAAARQTAVEAARGEYVLHVDSDDWLADGALAHLACAASDGADMVVFDYFEDYGSRLRLRRVDVSDDYVGALLCRRTAQNLWNKLVRRSLYDDFPFAPRLDYGEDFYAAAILADRAHGIIKLNEPLYYYNCANAGAMSAAPGVVKIGQIMALTERLPQELPARAADMAAMRQHTKVALLQAADQQGWALARKIPDTCLRCLNASQRLALWLPWWGMKIYRKIAKLKNLASLRGA